MESGGKNTKYEINNMCPNQIWFRVMKDSTFYGIEVPSNGFHSITEEKFSHIQGQIWESDMPETWSPSFESRLDDESSHHRITITPLMGPRTACSIKVLIACLAGPADPSVRNDTILAQKFKDFGVPAENITMLLEKQCTPKTITTMLENSLTQCNEGDVLFLYLGGHGTNSNGYYELCTHNGYTSSKMILDVLKHSKCEVFMVVDSCYSGLMIEDIKVSKTFQNKKNLHVLSSTTHDLCAMTGWRLVQLLIDNLFVSDSYSSPGDICKTVEEQLVTPQKGQKARVMIKRSSG